MINALDYFKPNEIWCSVEFCRIVTILEVSEKYVTTHVEGEEGSVEGYLQSEDLYAIENKEFYKLNDSSITKLLYL